MIAEEPGGRSSPTFLSSSSLKPLSRILPQTPPPAPPMTAPAMMLGGKIRPTRPPATTPRLAHCLPFGSLVSLNVTLPSVSCTTTAASTSLMEPPLSMFFSWLSDSVASYSLPNVATTTTRVLLSSVMSTTSAGPGDRRRRCRGAASSAKDELAGQGGAQDRDVEVWPAVTRGRRQGGLRPVRKHRASLHITLVLALVAGLLSAIGASAAGTASALVARGSAKQVYATGLAPKAKVALLDRHGHRVAPKNADP